MFQQAATKKPELRVDREGGRLLYCTSFVTFLLTKAYSVGNPLPYQPLLGIDYMHQPHLAACCTGGSRLSNHWDMSTIFVPCIQSLYHLAFHVDCLQLTIIRVP